MDKSATYYTKVHRQHWLTHTHIWQTHTNQRSLSFWLCRSTLLTTGMDAWKKNLGTTFLNTNTTPPSVHCLPPILFFPFFWLFCCFKASIFWGYFFLRSNSGGLLYIPVDACACWMWPFHATFSSPFNRLQTWSQHWVRPGKRKRESDIRVKVQWFQLWPPPPTNPNKERMRVFIVKTTSFFSFQFLSFCCKTHLSPWPHRFTSITST